jgi:hypothetical protein
MATMVADRVVGTERVNSVTFTLPDLPPSTNELMAPARASVNGSAQRWEIKTEWRLWRSQQQRYVKVLDIAEWSLVRVDLYFFYNFFYKNGQLKRFDTQNLINFAINTVAQKQGWDDLRCKHGSWGSAHDPHRPRVAVRLTEILESQWRHTAPRALALEGGQVR